MEYIDVTTASKNWGITTRRIRKLCEVGRIDGAVHNGWYWIIPSTSPRPTDGRILRKSKNLSVHPGGVDVDKFNKIKEKYSLEKKTLKGRLFLSSLSHTLNILLSLDGFSVSSLDIFSILSGTLVPTLSLEEHLVVVNFYSLLVSFLNTNEELSERKVKEIYTRLLQGVKDESGEYRNDDVKKRGSEMKVSVKEIMESFFYSYKSSYSKLYPLSQSVIVTGEIETIKPFKYLLNTFCYLLEAFILLKNSFLPPFVSNEIIEEGKASFSLVKTRGNYTSLTKLHERMIERMYKEVYGGLSIK